ncbi:MAG: hypothetical protein N4A44_00150 [Alphaproteobacteria bacterium]|jgi:lipopolysaccharide export LptBFGC system permease protein LptF|nr:hypothetical protein [Alphaproteobacteria bacterium]
MKKYVEYFIFVPSVSPIYYETEEISDNLYMDEIIQKAIKNNAFGFKTFEANGPNSTQENKSKTIFLVKENECELFTLKKLEKITEFKSKIEKDTITGLINLMKEMENMEYVVKCYNGFWTNFIKDNDQLMEIKEQ